MQVTEFTATISAKGLFIYQTDNLENTVCAEAEIRTLDSAEAILKGYGLARVTPWETRYELMGLRLVTKAIRLPENY